MLRKIVIGLACAAAIAFVAVPTNASARGGWHGHGSHGYGWHGYGWRGGWRGRGYYGYPGYYYPYAYYPYAYSCYRNVRVATPFGWQWRRVWVCG
jgi:hypothetical protein